jgi:hypothetical protein
VGASVCAGALGVSAGSATAGSVSAIACDGSRLWCKRDEARDTGGGDGEPVAGSAVMMTMG